MLIFLFGGQDLAAPLRQLGHDVKICAADHAADIVVTGTDPDWRVVANKAERLGLRPEAILVCDNVGYRDMPVGLWRSEAVTACYLIDSPLNEFWQTPYARLFDVAMFDQPTQAEALAQLGAKAHWLPLGVDPARYVGEMPARQSPEACFVGVVNPQVRPKRSAVLDRVQRQVGLNIKGGRKGQWFATEDAARLYKNHRVVINENLFPGLTTRPLEVMAAGGFLLTEAAPGVMDRHFIDLEHLLYFDFANLDERLSMALADEKMRRRIAKAGQEAVLSGHTLSHRAAQVIGHLLDATRDGQRLARRPSPAEATGLEGQALLMGALRWPAKDGHRRMLRATGRLRQAIVNKCGLMSVLRAAALAEMIMDEHETAKDHLRLVAEHGEPADSLALCLHAARLGDVGLQRQAVKDLTGALPGLMFPPGEAEFHLAAARLLEESGRAVSPGFNMSLLPQPAWNAFEHLLEATNREPTLAKAWLQGGDLLLNNGAPCEASVFFAKALALQPDQDPSQRLALARRRGYLT